MSGLERPPAWAIIGLIALVVANVGIGVLLLQRTGSAPTVSDARVATSAGASSASSASAPATSTAPATDTATPPTLAIYGDGYAAGNDLGGLGAAGFPALLAGAAGATLQLAAVPRAGYASLGTTAQDYRDMVVTNPAPGAAVTMVVGSRNDASAAPAVVGQNASSTFATIRADAPATVLVVVGPIWVDGTPPDGLLAVRDAVQEAALAAGAVFVDPLSDSWFSGQGGLISSDGVSPTDAGHAYLAERLLATTTAALTRAAAQG